MMIDRTVRASASSTITLADYSMTAFALLNGGRVIAYMPQIIGVYRCPHGATAVSLLTWIMFTAASAATVSYTVSSDFVVAGVFALNAFGCISIRRPGMCLLGACQR